MGNESNGTTLNPVQASTLSSEAVLVRDALARAGLETPMISNGLSAEC